MDDERRSVIFHGDVVHLEASEASKRLAGVALRHVRLAFGEDPRTAHERFGAEDLWARTCDARAALAEDDEARSASIALAETLGFARASLAVDAPRLRVVAPRMHLELAASRAFYTHRDTWYGSPRAQLNAWIPLFDVTERDSFAIYTRAFGEHVDNDSCAFDYARFSSRGGFQSAARIDAAYPRCLSAPPGDPLRVRARASDVVVFSAAHLHGTTPNETPRTRFSVDVRFVDANDVARDAGAPDVDNASRGSALADYFRCER